MAYKPNKKTPPKKVPRQNLMPDWFKYGELPARAGQQDAKLRMYPFSFGDQVQIPGNTLDIQGMGVGGSYDFPLNENLTLSPKGSLSNTRGSIGGNKVFNEVKFEPGLSLKYNFQQGGSLPKYQASSTNLPFDPEGGEYDEITATELNSLWPLTMAKPTSPPKEGESLSRRNEGAFSSWEWHSGKDGNPKGWFKHGGSRDPRTGLILKGRKHKTYHRTVEGEKAAGYEIIKGEDGRYYSFPKKQKGDSLPAYKGASTSITGYQGKGPNSGPYIIPSGDITMKGVNFPLIGTDNLGNTKIMKPGKNYKFPGSSVYETPLMKKGGKIGCGCKGACAKCGGHLPKYFGGGDVNWGQALGSAGSMAAAGTSIAPGIGTAIGGVIGLGTSLLGQSKQHKADEQAQADWDAFQEQRKADAKQFSALNKYINPNLSSTPTIDYGGSWQGLQTPMLNQGGFNQSPDFGTPFYQKGGKLPKYQDNIMGPPDYSPEQYERFYDNAVRALEEEQKRVDLVNKNSVALAIKAAENKRDFIRPLTEAKRDIAGKTALEKKGSAPFLSFDAMGYTNTPEGVRCYGDTCIYSATTLKGEAGSGHSPVTGNWTFRDKADDYGYEKISLKDKRPGDIIQFERKGTPKHAVTYGGEDDVYYDPGAYSSRAPYTKGSYDDYLNEFDNAAAYRYIGKRNKLQQEVEEARRQMSKNPRTMPLRGGLTSSPYSQELMVPAPYQKPTGPLASVPRSLKEGGNIYNRQNPHEHATFEAERPEIVRHEENNHPIALAHGGTINNSKNFTRLTGNRHSDAEGGGQFKGAGGGFVYSDFIKVPKDLENKFKNLV